MTNSPEKIIQYLLVEGGQGGLPGTVIPAPSWIIYAHSIIDESDQAIFILGSADHIEGKDMRAGYESEHFGIQIIIRAKDPETAKVKAKTVQDYLLTQLRKAVAVGSANFKVQSITKTSGIIPLQQEEKNRRYPFSSNYIATISEV